MLLLFLSQQNRARMTAIKLGFLFNTKHAQSSGSAGVNISL